jgi:hypothetical protein
MDVRLKAIFLISSVWVVPGSAERAYALKVMNA